MSSLQTYKQLACMFATKIKHNIDDAYKYYTGSQSSFTVERVEKIVLDGEDVSFPKVYPLQKIYLYLSSATLITEAYGFKIFLGNSWNASDLNFLQANEINRVLNISVEVPNFFENKQPLIEYKRYAIRDISDQQIDFATLVQFCKDSIEDRPNILIHCFMGASRSVLVCLVILSLLSKKYDDEVKTVEDLYRMIHSKRQRVHINKAFFNKWKAFSEAALLKID